MKYNKKIIFVFLLMLGIKTVNAAVLDLWNIFPNNQGDNGVYAYAYSGSYRLLSDLGEFYFGTPGKPWNIPYICRGDSPWIVTHPSGLEFQKLESTRLSFIVPSYIASIYKLTGTIDPWDGGKINFRIWKNLNMIYDVSVYSNVVSFDLPVNILTGDTLIFEVTAGNSDYSYNDTTFYNAKIYYTPAPVPEPITFLLLLIGFLSFIIFKKYKDFRTIKSKLLQY